jgi:hypothetical protein
MAEYSNSNYKFIIMRIYKMKKHEKRQVPIEIIGIKE